MLGVWIRVLRDAEAVAIHVRRTVAGDDGFRAVLARTFIQTTDPTSDEFTHERLPKIVIDSRPHHYYSENWATNRRRPRSSNPALAARAA
jgi:hypothetical protein